MPGLRARVQNGRLVVDDEGDDMDDAERTALEASIARGLADARAGNVRPAADVTAELRRKS